MMMMISAAMQSRTRCLLLLQSSSTSIILFFQIHAQMFRNHLFPADSFAARRALEFVVSSPKGANLDYARKMFDQIPHPNTFAWNNMIRCYANSLFPARSLGLFSRMIRSSDAKPNSYTYPFLLKACARLSAVREGEKLHGLMVSLGADADVFSINGLINMYAACGKIEASRVLFDAALMGRDTATWNSMLSGYLNCGLIICARKLFDSMPDKEKGIVTWNVMINGYSRHGEIDTARLLFDRMPERNDETWNTLMVGYAKCGLLDAARKLFDEMPNRNAVSWSAMITAYTRGDQPNEALRLFGEMENSSCLVEPNLSTIVSALSASAQLGAVEQGKRVHNNYIDRNKMKVDSIIGTALIDMYAKFGCIETATSVFRALKTPKHVFPWTAMISGLAANGHGAEALALFREMESTGVRPNGITFVGVLSACSHGGWVDSAMEYMNLMTEVYGLEPESEHYGCIVDALGRVGRLTEAVSFIEAMPRRWINDVIWLTLVGSCSFYGDVPIGEYALKRLNQLDRSGDVYVLISNIYAMNGRWIEARNARSIMESKGIQKCPGRSSIEIGGIVHEFHSGEKSHGGVRDIYLMARIVNFRER